VVQILTFAGDCSIHKSMEKREFECRVITPLFMSGADVNRAELRPSEFKGMMRFWWRAARAEPDWRRLREQEAKIFGGAGEGEGRSRFFLRVSGEPEVGRNLKEDYELKWELKRVDGSKTLIGDHAGIGYLLYSTTGMFLRPYFKPGGKFYLKLIMEEEVTEQVLAALWLSVVLGSFGARSRRGGGSILCVPSCKKKDLTFKPQDKDAEEISAWLRKNLALINKILKPSLAKQVQYSNFKDSNIIISQKSFFGWEQALNDIGKIYKNFRFKKRKQFLKVAYFGFPILHFRGRNLRIEVKAGKRKEERWEYIERRASPLWIKILSNGEEYFWMAIRFNGQFLPPDAEIIEVEKRKNNNKWKARVSNTLKQPDSSLLNEFWEILREKGKEINLIQP